MPTQMQNGFITKLLASLLAITLAQTACSPADPMPTPSEPTVILPTAASIQDGAPSFSLDSGSLASSFQAQTIAAVPSSENAPYWEILPEHTQVTLQDYPISNHLMQPQIFIYPVKELGEVNEGAGMIAAALQNLLQSPQESAKMPFLPLINAAQMIHAQVQYLNFKNGRGVRYITELSQGIVPINNHELIYTYQGLTDDGKYYVAAILPVSHSSLPMDGSISEKELENLSSDFSAYITDTANSLNSLPADSFLPTLTQLDAMMSSLEIR
jgi:hypothetical protein